MKSLLLYNPWFAVATVSWIIAQTFKMIISTWQTRRFDFSRLVDSGGMPSSHTSFVSGLSASVGITEGFDTAAFGIVLCISLIVIYDATNVRRSAGYHAQVLNEIIPQLLQGKLLQRDFNYRKLRELLGHNPIEVFVGVILGILVAISLSPYFPLKAG